MQNPITQVMLSEFKYLPLLEYMEFVNDGSRMGGTGCPGPPGLPVSCDTRGWDAVANHLGHSIQLIGTPTKCRSAYHLAELQFQSVALETKSARTGFSCIYLSFSSSFAES